LTLAIAGLASILVTAGFLTGIGDVEHHQPAMTASLFQRFCKTFITLLNYNPGLIALFSSIVMNNWVFKSARRVWYPLFLCGRVKIQPSDDSPCERGSAEAEDTRGSRGALPSVEYGARGGEAGNKRNGTTTLFAALNMLDGKVIGACLPRHRHREFLSQVDRSEDPARPRPRSHG
jgi:hypothetical protein